MSAAGTPSKVQRPGATEGDHGGNDPLQTVKAARTREGTSQDTQGADDAASPAKKRQASGTLGIGGGTPSSAGRGNIFSAGRRISASASAKDNAPKHLSMPPPTSFDSTPTRRRPSGASFRGGTRRISAAVGNPAAGRSLGPGEPVSPGGTLGRRIQDWQSRNALSPGELPTSPGEEEDDDPPPEPEVIVPAMLPGLKTPEYQTPLPKIAITVLAIIMIGEFMSANLASPFLFPMLEDFGTPSGRDEASIGFWAGIVASVFFLSQFLTAVVWGSIANKFGRRNVLFASLLGNTAALIFYGTSQSVGAMLTARVLQGAFNGAVGVAKTAVRDITDSSNEGRAYAVMGLCWSLGGIVGPIFGGWLEHPVENIPSLFGNSQLFRRYPYLLPTMAAGSVTLLGATLCLFLSYDGGPREGGIRLPEEKDVERAISTVGSLPGSVKKKVSGYFGQSGGASGQVTPSGVESPLPAQQQTRTLSIHHKPSRTSFAVPHQGSAYGYSRRDTGLSRYRRLSAATATRYGPEYEGEGAPDLPPLNLAQRLLIANDEAGTFNISDIWLASATRDEGDPYTAAGLEEDVFAEDEDEDELNEGTSEARDPFVEGTETPEMRSRHHSMVTGTTERRRSPVKAGLPGRARLGSMASTVARPALYQNTGLSRSPITSPAGFRDPAAYPQQEHPGSPAPAAPQGLALAAIPEGRPAPHAESSNLLTVPGAAAADEPAPTLADEKHPLETFSIWRDLPIALIGQYTVLGFHGTVTDQIFVSYLVTKAPSGGLGLQASDYADIIAFMCFFQMLFQFRFYPLVSLPNGKLTHLQMFRLGLCLYLIPYLLFPELRPLLKPDGEKTGVVTFGLILLTATRYLATTCAYTSIMILINAMTPPAYLPLANGLAQSAISLSRFFGPLIGGVIWSKSIANGPEGYYIGFMVVAGVCVMGLLHSLTIR